MSIYTLIRAFNISARPTRWFAGICDVRGSTFGFWTSRQAAAFGQGLHCPGGENCYSTVDSPCLHHEKGSGFLPKSPQQVTIIPSHITDCQHSSPVALAVRTWAEWLYGRRIHAYSHAVTPITAHQSSSTATQQGTSGRSCTHNRATWQMN